MLLFSNCKKEEEEDVKLLDGIWKAKESWVVKIDEKSGTGTFVKLDAEEHKEGLSKFLKVGDLAIKDLKEISNHLWTGKEIMWYYYTTTGEIVYTDWQEVTYTLNDANNQLTRSSSAYGGEIIYYKVKDINYPVPALKASYENTSQQEKIVKNIEQDLSGGLSKAIMK
jgi:hypothetical protein